VEDDVLSTPFLQEAFDMIEAEIGQPLERVFSRISASPIAAASLGQVYKATLVATGEEVAIKVREDSCQLCQDRIEHTSNAAIKIRLRLLSGVFDEEERVCRAGLYFTMGLHGELIVYSLSYVDTHIYPWGFEAVRPR
jgi:hypothetical protein